MKRSPFLSLASLSSRSPRGPLSARQSVPEISVHIGRRFPEAARRHAPRRSGRRRHQFEGRHLRLHAHRQSAP